MISCPFESTGALPSEYCQLTAKCSALRSGRKPTFSDLFGQRSSFETMQPTIPKQNPSDAARFLHEWLLRAIVWACIPYGRRKPWWETKDARENRTKVFQETPSIRAVTFETKIVRSSLGRTAPSPEAFSEAILFLNGTKDSSNPRARRNRKRRRRSLDRPSTCVSYRSNQILRALSLCRFVTGPSKSTGG